MCHFRNLFMRHRMKLRTLTACSVLGSLALTAAHAQAQSASGMPHLEKRGTLTQLIVDGKPFIILGGQVGNPTGFPDRMQRAGRPSTELQRLGRPVPPPQQSAICAGVVWRRGQRLFRHRAARGEPSVIPESEHEPDRSPERQRHGLRADQRFHPEQLRAAAAAQPAVHFLELSAISGQPGSLGFGSPRAPVLVPQ